MVLKYNTFITKKKTFDFFQFYVFIIINLEIIYYVFNLNFFSFNYKFFWIKTHVNHN